MEKSNVSDQEIIQLIMVDQDSLGIVFKNSKDYCLLFMRKISAGSSVKDQDLFDIFQDAMIIFYEKIKEGHFKLTSSIQTYLNSVCRYQLLNKFKELKKTTSLESDDSLLTNKNLFFDPKIEDTLDPIDSTKDDQFSAIEKALETIKQAGGKCYELLTLFWYHKKTMIELTEHFGYSNPSNTKNQKAKCQKRLQKIAYNNMQS